MKNKECDKLRKEIEQLMNSKPGYTELNKLNEIIERLDELEQIENKFSVEDSWQEFKRNYLIGLCDHKKKKSQESIE